MLSPPPPSFPCVSVLFLACYLAAMPLPWLTHDTRQWTVSFRPHLLLCYEPCEVDSKSFGYTPSVCLATGIISLYTVLGLPATSDWTAVLQGSSVLVCWLVPTPCRCLFNVARQWTVFSWPHLLLRYESMVIDI